MRADHRERPINVVRRFGVKGNPTGAGLGKAIDQGIDRTHHQMYIDRRGHTVLTKRRANRRTKGQIWNVVVVHHVEVNNIGARFQNRVNFTA